jgi:hypothetical protein
VGAFPLRPEQAQQLDRTAADAAEPVRNPRVELAAAAAVNADLIAEETRRALQMKCGHYPGHPTGQHSGQSSGALA